MRNFDIQRPNLDDTPDGGEDVFSKSNSLRFCTSPLDSSNFGIPIWVCFIIDKDASFHRPRKTLRYSGENFKVKNRAQSSVFLLLEGDISPK